MKPIVNENGEVEMVETKNEIVLRELQEVGTTFEEYEQMQDQLDYLKEQIETWEISHRDIIMDALKRNNVKSLKTNSRTYTYVSETTQTRLDTDRLKEDGTYYKYLKLVPTKESLRITKRRDK